MISRVSGNSVLVGCQLYRLSAKEIYDRNKWTDLSFDRQQRYDKTNLLPGCQPVRPPKLNFLKARVPK